MGNLRKPKDWTEEERQNVVNVFAWLLKEDKKQNPHLYKKMQKPPKSIRITEKN